MTTLTIPPVAVPRDLAGVETELEKIFSMIAAAHRLLVEGQVIDLGALEGHVHGACKTALELPPAEAQQLSGKLGNLLDQLDGLATAMHSRFGDLPIMPSHSVSTAAAAYANMLKHYP